MKKHRRQLKAKYAWYLRNAAWITFFNKIAMFDSGTVYMNSGGMPNSIDYDTDKTLVATFKVPLFFRGGKLNLT